MDCKNCGAPLEQVPGQGYLRCGYCSSIRLPKETDEGVRWMDEPAETPCPVCGTGLVTCTVETQPGSYCPGCQGLLLPQKSFAKALRGRRARYQGERLPSCNPQLDTTRRRTLECPVCHQPMNAYPYLGPGAVILDNCSACWLIWLDNGELTIMERS